MNTFLVSFDLKQNAKFLDNRRLFKQLLEGYQILKTLATGEGWIHHPAVLQWKGYESHLFIYITSIWEECKNKKIALNSDIAQKSACIYLDKFFKGGDKMNAPHWWNREDIAASHRSRLRCKGFIDAACVDIKRDLKLKSIDRWLKENFGLAKNALKFKHLELLLKTSGVEFKTPSHYEQFGWTEDPAGEYIWSI